MAMMDEVENCLQSLMNLKPPGISGSKVKELTTLCSQNVQSESILIQKLYMHFKKAPAAYKLGILYMIDSVARDYLSQARKAGEELSPTAPDGTYSAGHNRIKDIMPTLIGDMAMYVPDSKEKIIRLFEIWSRGNTFPPDTIAQCKAKLETPALSPNAPRSTTPPGEPPAQKYLATEPPQSFADAIQSQQQAPQQEAQQQSENAASTASLLKALANMSKNTKLKAQPPVMVNQPPPQSLAPVVQPPPITQAPPMAAQHNIPQHLTPLLPPQLGQGLQAPLPPQPPQPTVAAQNQAHLAQISQIMQPTIDPNVQGQMALLQLLLQQGLPLAQLGPAIAPLLGNLAPGALPGWQQPVAPQQQQPQPAIAQQDNRFDDRGTRERGRYSPPPRSPPPYRRGRTRSRSPGYNRRESPPAFRRRSPTYDDYGNETTGRDPEFSHGGRGGRGRVGHGRRSSPDRRRRDRTGSPPARGGRTGRNGDSRFDAPDIPAGPKLVEHDPTLPKDHIKVYSRTLFVGGVARNTEEDLRELFETYGRVQTCIVNYEKRHAFIKMFTRKDAIAAKEGMEQYRSPEMTLRTRWGVGFGPRDCSDYTTGVSIIPLDRLTDADRRWMLTATHGGTGGQPLVGGIVVEEPDIEIGQGVSSKAMSKRRPTDSGGPGRGPQSSFDNSPRRSTRQSSPPTTSGVAPPTPNFGSAQPFGAFPYPFTPGAVPPAWMFPGQQQQQ